MVQAAEATALQRDREVSLYVEALDKFQMIQPLRLRKADAEAAARNDHEETPADEGETPSSEEAKLTSPTSPKPALETSLKHQRQTINQLGNCCINGKTANKEIEDREDVNHRRCYHRAATMRLVPTLLQIRLSME